MKKKVYQKGQIINESTFIKELPQRIQPNGKKKRKAVIKCKCGNEFEAYLYNVISGLIKSCKTCSHKRVGEINSTHKLSNHKLFSIWYDIKRRCYDKNNKRYPSYGSKGITMYKGWIDDFKEFYDYVIKLENYKESDIGIHNLTIDRKNTLGNYEPGNIRLVNATIQNFNKVLQKNNKTGYRCISIRSNGNYQVKVSYKRKQHYIGTYKTIEESIEQRNKYLIINKIPNDFLKYE